MIMKSKQQDYDDYDEVDNVDDDDGEVDDNAVDANDE